MPVGRLSTITGSFAVVAITVERTVAAATIVVSLRPWLGSRLHCNGVVTVVESN